MPRNPVETETLAQLYLDQGHPDRAAAIYQRLLQEDPGRQTAAEGLERARAAHLAHGEEVGMNLDRRLAVLKRMLARLTGELEPALVLPLMPVPAVAVAFAAHAPAPPAPMMPARPAANPLIRRLEVLRAMLAKLTRQT